MWSRFELVVAEPEAVLRQRLDAAMVKPQFPKLPVDVFKFYGHLTDDGFRIRAVMCRLKQDFILPRLTRRACWLEMTGRFEALESGTRVMVHTGPRWSFLLVSLAVTLLIFLPALIGLFRQKSSESVVLSVCFVVFFPIIWLLTFIQNTWLERLYRDELTAILTDTELQ